MSTLNGSPTDDLTQSTNFNSPRRVSPGDPWIGSHVRTKRTSRGISEQEFCTALSIHGNDLTAFEAGEKRINANLLMRIATLIDVRPDYFFRGYTD